MKIIYILVILKIILTEIRTDEQINYLCEKIVKLFIKENCKAIVIACNTASAKSAKYLREKYPNMKFIAIEPAYKMVHDYSYDNPTLVMATKGLSKVKSLIFYTINMIIIKQYYFLA